MELSTSEINELFQQLNNRHLPFRNYTFSFEDGALKKVGQGGFATVYSACKRGRKKEEYVIKVVGLQDRQLDWAKTGASFSKMQSIAISCKSIASILKYADVTLWLDEENRICKVEKGYLDETLDVGSKRLYLQFILMKKYQSIISYNSYGRPSLSIEKLKRAEEKELIHLAYDISNALLAMHQEGILHRDIKVENILYDAQKKRYLLSDFDVTKEIGEDFAKTKVGTNGYVAPEVMATFQEYYDYTADIYSLGMVFYVLLNGFKFPETTNYKVGNIKHYRPNYSMPKPEHTFTAFFSVIEKMCAYNPDDRYQSMEEVVNAIEMLLLPKVAFQRTQKFGAMLGGSFLLLIGLFIWGLLPGKSITVSAVDWKLILFVALCLWRGLPRWQKNRNTLLDIGIFVLSFFVDYPFSGGLWYLLLFFILLDGSGVCSFVGLVVAIGPSVFVFLKEFLQLGVLHFATFSWISVSLMIIGMMLLGQYACMNSRSDSKEIRLLQKCYLYICLYISFIIQQSGYDYVRFLGYSAETKERIRGAFPIFYDLPLSYGWMEKCSWYINIFTYDLIKIGNICIVFCLIWLVLEFIWARYHSRGKKIG